MAAIAPCFWLPGRAEEAAAFYLDAFRRAGQPAERRGEMRMGAEGALVAVTVVLAGQELMLFNPPGEQAHTPAVSLFLTCSTQEEVDATVARAEAAGGTADPGPKQDYGFMYGRSFEDPDGHVWEAVWMDVAAARSAMGKE